jgi:hypothetical protein
VEIFELRLPRGAVVTLVVRSGETLVPDGSTRIQRGDELLLVVPADLRDVVEQRLRAVSRAGRLAGWKGEQGREEVEQRPYGPPRHEEPAAEVRRPRLPRRLSSRRGRFNGSGRPGS